MPEKVAVVGAGIVGIAHAWREAARGASVTLFERSLQAQGASVRNFGMVWPIGQPTETLESALQSRALWEELLDETGLWSSRQGSLHVAHRADEWAVLEEFAASSNSEGYQCELISRERVLQLCPGVSATGLLGGLYSRTEMGVDPREIIAKAPRWLSDRYQVELRYGTSVQEISLPELITSDGKQWRFDRVVVATGAEFRTLYPDFFAQQPLGKCKLQMLRTVAQPGGWRLGPMVASGLTLRHYRTFERLHATSALKARIANEAPELDRYGIHVMASQNAGGELILGDSHEYDDEASPFDSELISELILRELGKILCVPDWSLSARWHGIYPTQSSRELQFVAEPEPGVQIVVATGGCGMTMSFGLAEQLVARRTAALV